MGTNLSGNRARLGIVFAVATALSVSFSHRVEQRAVRPGICDREAETLVDQKPVRIRGSVRAPKKIRYAWPKYPAAPPGTTGSGMWIGEALINTSGKVVRVWPIREVEFEPPFPSFNSAIADAIRQWEFEPLILQGKAAPVCMTVTVNINWS